MSIIFYDRLIVLEGLDKKIKKLVSSNDEIQEIWAMIEELIHHRVFGCILDSLPEKHHTEFLNMFHRTPYDKGILKYLNEKSKKDMEKVIKNEIKILSKELLLLNSNKV